MPDTESPTHRTKSIIGRWLPPVLWMGSIFFLSNQPDLPHAPGPWFDFLIKKTGHAAAYGILAWLFLRALRGENTATDRMRWISFALAFAYGGSDELHQAFVVGRNASLTDVLIDGGGAATAMILHRWLSRQAAKRQ